MKNETYVGFITFSYSVHFRFGTYRSVANPLDNEEQYVYIYLQIT